MSDISYQPKATRAWKAYSIASFVLAAVMNAGGVFFMEASFAAKGFYAMAVIMLVHCAISVTRLLRDEEEGRSMVSRLDEARTEELLRQASRNREDL
ncbi:YiaA/YiaB family inner membrane protein [Fulvimarina sp. MAC8]|uniref:YiaA/YiaB family inner membrane protein n=1 Tax=Fulvimarina sp. MAC8 TaxID=3162874 RepID=UPI0032ED94AA